MKKQTAAGPVMEELAASENVGIFSGAIHGKPSIEGDRHLLGRRWDLHPEGNEEVRQPLRVELVLEPPHFIPDVVRHGAHQHRACDEAHRHGRLEAQGSRHGIGHGIQLLAWHLSQLRHVLPNQHAHLTGLQLVATCIARFKTQVVWYKLVKLVEPSGFRKPELPWICFPKMCWGDSYFPKMCWVIASSCEGCPSPEQHWHPCRPLGTPSWSKPLSPYSFWQCWHRWCFGFSGAACGKFACPS